MDIGFSSLSVADQVPDQVPDAVPDQVPDAVPDVQAMTSSNTEEDEEGDEEGDEEDIGGNSKKKKAGKKNKKKKKPGPSKMAAGLATVAEGLVQTEPPSIPVSKFYVNGIYPHGELHTYVDHNTYRTTSEEKRAAEKVSQEQYNDLRKAAEVHRQVRKDALKFMQPGRSMTEICERIENGVKVLIEANGLKAGAPATEDGLYA